MASITAGRCRFGGREEEPFSPALLALAEECGVDVAYEAAPGVRIQSSPAAVRAVLAALGADAHDDAAAAAALAAREAERWRRALRPTIAVTQEAGGVEDVAIPVGALASAKLDLDDDPALGGGGGTVVLGRLDARAQAAAGADEREVDGRALRRLPLRLPPGLPLGWHALTLTWAEGGVPVRAHAQVLVSPARLRWPEALGDGQAWGVMAQLYSLRSRGSWGTGDFADLAVLAETVARHGADFILVNPVYAVEPTPHLSESPYLPMSRLFLNPIYIRPQAIAEWRQAPGAARAEIAALALAAGGFDGGGDDGGGTERGGGDDGGGPPSSAFPGGEIDRDRAWAAKRRALELLFAVPRAADREAAFGAYRAAQGAALADFAVWSLLAEGTDPALPRADQLAPGSAEAAAIARARPDRIAFYAWLQWVADEQLGAAQARARAAGLRLGLVGDLPVGVHPAGAETWMLAGLLARGIEVGAPPDLPGGRGQGWAEPAFRPEALERTGYAAYRAIVRAAMAHVGALRVDHVLGCFRLWWIPVGHSPADGAYVRYDAEAMTGLVALEARRAGVVVIGEDVGLAAPGARRRLAERGFAGQDLVWPGAGDAGDGSAVRRLTLACLTTHDLPPTAALLTGSHIPLLAGLGLLEGGAAEALAAVAARRAGVVARLARGGWLAPGAGGDDVAVLAALHAYLRDRPTALAGVALADLAGEERPQNLPGTDREYPNWSVPLAGADGRPVYLEDLPATPRFQAVVRAVAGA